MKKYIFLLLAIISFQMSSQAQDFKTMLTKTWTTFDTTNNTATRAEASNKLGLIAKKWNEEWAAHYYNALSKIILSYTSKDEALRDSYIDEAEKERDETVRLLGKENDETYVIAAMVANARLAVKPQSRWQTFGKVFDENIAKAKELNPNNPRIYYLQGTSKRYTPKMFGGGKKKALPYFEKADSLFAKQPTHDILTITWGKSSNDTFLNEAKTEDKE
ncbi:MAG: hypothetical protein JST52_03085 [Bacteroidetes bacterium]|nr:hypothetical protein [Bacteroidota bacterium]MBS1740936.1 hypothetical protein [Bacteroidota bacterium]